MNYELLGLWMSLIGGGLGAVLIVAFLLTGQKHAILRIMGAVLILIGVGGSVMANYIF